MISPVHVGGVIFGRKAAASFCNKLTNVDLINWQIVKLTNVDFNMLFLLIKNTYSPAVGSIIIELKTNCNSNPELLSTTWTDKRVSKNLILNKLFYVLLKGVFKNIQI